MPTKHTPIRPMGQGNQGCYLAAISDTLGGLLYQLVQATHPVLPEALDDAWQAIQATQEAERLASVFLPATEKAQLVRARRGQGLFRLRVEAIASGCRLTHTTDKRFLVASHIKP